MMDLLQKIRTYELTGVLLQILNVLIQALLQ